MASTSIQPLPVILWDLDGTLVDTARDILRALNEVLAEELLSPIDEATLRALVGRGARVLIRRALALHGTAVPEAKLSRMVARLVEIYAQAPTLHSDLFEGMADVLDRLKALGYRQVIATNKPQPLAEAVVAGLGLDHYFDGIYGPERVTEKKPAAQHLLEAAGLAEDHFRQGLAAIMIGDSNTDRRAARAAHMPCILVTFGYSAEDVSTLGAEALTDTASAIPALIEALSSAASR